MSNILVKRSKAQAMPLGSWDDALKEADTLNPWGYERRHAALHGLQRYDEAIDAFARMLSLFEDSPNPDAPTNDHTRALRLVVRLQQPFHALLLQQQPNGEFRRVAVEREIFVPGIERAIHVCRDVCTGVVEIL